MRNDLRQHQRRKDQPTAQKLPGRHALVEEHGAEEGPEHAFKAHDEGGEGRGQVPLAHDLQPVGDAAGEDAAVEDAEEGGPDVLKAEPLEDGHGQQAQQPRREKLQTAQGQGIEVGGELVHQQDLEGEHQGA